MSQIITGPCEVTNTQVLCDAAKRLDHQVLNRTETQASLKLTGFRYAVSFDTTKKQMKHDVDDLQLSHNKEATQNKNRIDRLLNEYTADMLAQEAVAAGMTILERQVTNEVDVELVVCN